MPKLKSGYFKWKLYRHIYLLLYGFMNCVRLSEDLET